MKCSIYMFDLYDDRINTSHYTEYSQDHISTFLHNHINNNRRVIGNNQFKTRNNKDKDHQLLLYIVDRLNINIGDSIPDTELSVVSSVYFKNHPKQLNYLNRVYDDLLLKYPEYCV